MGRYKHGDSYTKLYKVWLAMIHRCNDTKHPRYKNYGARNIKVCKEWQEYESFREWAWTTGYIEGLSIERIDNNGNYCPKNCKWIAKGKQALNRTNTVYVYVYVKKPLIQVCREEHLPYESTWLRVVRKGQDINKIIEKRRKRNGTKNV